MIDLRRLQVAVRSVLVLGVSASVAANILAAQPSPVARAIAAWPPCALLLTIELIAKVPVHSVRLAWSRRLAATAIAGIAAWASYWHMVEVASSHRERADSAHLLPASVDGLVVVASICLVEIAAQLRSDTRPVADAATRPDRVDPIPASDPIPSPAAEDAGSESRIRLLRARPDPASTTGPDPVLAQVQADVKAGRVKPTADAIRERYRIGPKRARALRDALTTDQDDEDEREAADA